MKISELPEDVKAKALEYQRSIIGWDRNTDILVHAFDWGNTKEGIDYWHRLWKQPTPETPQHYDNSKGSIYKFCDEQGLNSYEFDLIKRIVRCRKKGQFKEDLEKTKVLIDLYLKEFEK